jgi:ABC-type branched-subunit amino acid transport system substrate-binding protein
VTDEPELPLAGLDAERPLPPELRARLEAALLAAAAGGLPVPADAESLDAPRPLPEALRTRLESALLAEAAAAVPAEAAAPPAAVAATAASEAAEVVPLEARRRKVVAVWSSVAAVLLLVIAVAGLAGRGGSGTQHVAVGPTTSTAGAPVSIPSGTGATEPPAPAAVEAATAPAPPATTPTSRPGKPAPGSGQPTTTTNPIGPVAPSPAPTGPANPNPGGTGDPAGGSSDPGPAPPFYNSSPSHDSAPSMATQPATPAPSSGSGGSGANPPQGATPPQSQKSATPATGSPLRVGIVTGDAAQQAGFGAYIDRLNQSGGVRGHSIELVTVGPGAPAAGTIATVNLSTLPVAGPGGPPSWATGPLLETLSAPESLLAGDGAVFSFASPPERQGHLAVDALFPSAVADHTTTAVIYAAPSGPLGDTVPKAMQSALEARGVKVVVSVYDPAASKTTLVDRADAAFLSLDPAAAKAWVAQAKQAGYHPGKGVAGIYSLADDTLAPDLPEGARVVSPYAAPSGDEAQAIRSGAGGTSAPVLHGWVSAKALAAAIWRTGADTPAELQTALEGLAGWSPGLAPPYETRPGTRSRTPEGVVLQVQSGAFVADGGFRRDPRPSAI